MNLVWAWIKRLLLILVTLLALLLAPVGYNEIACRGLGTPTTGDYASIITDPVWQRAESRTLLTYPEWHIVHAYDDYARVIAEGDPHNFRFWRAIRGFWNALCPLTERAADMGGVTGETKMTIYTIGVSFSAEMALKAAYEETLGRFTTWMRAARSPLDDLSALQARDYATFLQQTPWYKYDFLADEAELASAATDVPRDRERLLALGTEYRAKAAYAEVIASAVEDIGADALRLRSIVTGIGGAALSRMDGIAVVAERTEGIEIETDRYRVFTRLLERLAETDADLVEIAGNDEILFTAISPNPTEDGALHSFPRQGYGDYRHLILVPVSDLLDTIRGLGGLTLEHVHDY